MNRPVIISLGEVLWDLFPDGPRFGGAPANFACHAAALGASVFMGSALGNDKNGRKALDVLHSYRIDTSLIQRIASGPTGTVKVRMNGSGQHRFTLDSESAWDWIAWTHELETQIPETDALYFGTLGQRGNVSRTTIRKSLDAAQRLGIHRVLDLNLRTPHFDAPLIRESVERCSILKLSDDELDELMSASGLLDNNHPEESLRTILEHYDLDLVAMTRGPDGALLVTPSEVIDQSGIPTQVRDTVGAGDSFTAALIVGLLQKEALSSIASKACTLAADVCAQSGAVPEITNSTSFPA